MKHIVITGASTGIGAALARELGRPEDVRLTLVARRRPLLEELAAELGAERCHIVAADLGADATGWLPGAVAALGPVDVLVNNAGLDVVRALHETTTDEVERCLRLNLHTPLALTRAVLPAMIARRSGTIVDVASVAALAPARGYTVYAASKAGLAAASEALRGEVKGHGVHVVTVYPGPIHTDMGARALSELEPTAALGLAAWGDAATLAALTAKAIARRRARVIYPRTYVLARLFPAFTRFMTDLLSPPPKPLGPGLAAAGAPFSPTPVAGRQPVG
jgi:short-subunit dehydrogenase